MTLAGELVLTRNQLVQAVASGNSQAIQATAQRVDLVTSELQEAIMSTRMQPIGNVFNKFQRVVRDMSRDLVLRTAMKGLKSRRPLQYATISTPLLRGGVLRQRCRLAHRGRRG
jgi:hypothetical protein